MLETLVCIIPARGGSKRIPRKNIAAFNGKPLIGWSIESALHANIFSRVIVSTDDAEIAAVAKHHGAEIPFMRDENLSDDFATTADVLTDALSRLPECTYACCLYPTAPMITPSDLKNAYTKIKTSAADCVMSVTDYDFHPLRAFARQEDGTVSFHWPEYELTRSQDLPEMLHDAGAFYFFNVQTFLKSGKLIAKNTIGMKLPRKQAVDIDTQEDFELAQALHLLEQEGKS
ncbi:MAG: pseudaminic acid cytidylyltransferase [Pseudomonadota bacterium]